MHYLTNEVSVTVARGVQRGRCTAPSASRVLLAIVCKVRCTKQLALCVCTARSVLVRPAKNNMSAQAARPIAICECQCRPGQRQRQRSEPKRTRKTRVRTRVSTNNTNVFATFAFARQLHSYTACYDSLSASDSREKHGARKAKSISVGLWLL